MSKSILIKATRSSQKKNDNTYPVLTTEEKVISMKKARNQIKNMLSTYISALSSVKPTLTSSRYRHKKVSIMKITLENLLSIV